MIYKRLAAGVTAAVMVGVFSTGCTFKVDSTESKSKPTETVTVEAEPSQTPESDTTTDVDVDAVFLDLLRSEYPADFGPVPDSLILDSAQAVCAGFESGMDFYEIGLQMVEAGFDPEVAGYFIGATVAAYCPDYGSQLNA